VISGCSEREFDAGVRFWREPGPAWLAAERVSCCRRWARLQSPSWLPSPSPLLLLRLGSYPLPARPAP